MGEHSAKRLSLMNRKLEVLQLWIRYNMVYHLFRTPTMLPTDIYTHLVILPCPGIYFLFLIILQIILCKFTCVYKDDNLDKHALTLT